MAAAPRYRIDGGELVAISAIDATILWRHTLPACIEPQLATLLHDPPGCILLASDPNCPANSRITRFKPNGEIAWQTPSDTTYGDWLSLRLESNNIIANTWNGYLVTLDCASGKIRNAEFTK